MRIGPTVEVQAMGHHSDGGITFTANGAYPEMRASVLSPRETAVDWMRSVVGTSRAGNVLTGAFDAWLAAPDALSKLPDALGAIPAATMRLASSAASYAGRLWDDPLGTAANTMAGGVDGLRSGFNQTVNGNGLAMGSTLFALGTAAVPRGDWIGPVRQCCSAQANSAAWNAHRKFSWMRLAVVAPSPSQRKAAMHCDI